MHYNYGGMPKIRIIGLINGRQTAFDGQYVVEYDPSREGTDPEGNLMLCHLVTTPDLEKALELPVDKCLELWKKANGIRPDGLPNRPITAFTVEITP